MRRRSPETAVFRGEVVFAECLQGEIVVDSVLTRAALGSPAIPVTFVIRPPGEDGPPAPSATAVLSVRLVGGTWTPLRAMKALRAWAKHGVPIEMHVFAEATRTRLSLVAEGGRVMLESLDGAPRFDASGLTG